MIEKLAYELYLDRIKEEERCQIPLGNAESDWRRAEQIITFFKSPRENTWKWGNTWDDYAKHWGTYQRLKCQV